MRRAEQQGRVRRGIGLMAGALAFLFQAVAFFSLVPAMSGTMAICTADGIEYRLIPDGTGQPGGKENPTAKNGCPLCPVMAGVATPPPLIATEAPGAPSRHDRRALPGAHIAAGWFLSTLQARAPPAIA